MSRLDNWTRPVKMDNKNTHLYGRIKTAIIRGILCVKKIQAHKAIWKKILELRKQGVPQREIAEKIGFRKNQVKKIFHRYNRNQRKLAAGIAIKTKGRPRKDGTELPPSVQQLSKAAQLQYKLAMKERQIKRLKMENELTRDFLRLAEGKRGQA